MASIRCSETEVATSGKAATSEAGVAAIGAAVGASAAMDAVEVAEIETLEEPLAVPVGTKSRRAVCDGPRAGYLRPPNLVPGTTAAAGGLYIMSLRRLPNFTAARRT